MSRSIVCEGDPRDSDQQCCLQKQEHGDASCATATERVANLIRDSNTGNEDGHCKHLGHVRRFASEKIRSADDKISCDVRREQPTEGKPACDVHHSGDQAQGGGQVTCLARMAASRSGL